VTRLFIPETERFIRTFLGFVFGELTRPANGDDAVEEKKRASFIMRSGLVDSGVFDNLEVEFMVGNWKESTSVSGF